LDVSPAVLTGIAEWYLSIPSELRLQIKGRFALSFAFAFAKYLGELRLFSSAASVAWALLQSCPNETDATQDFLSPTVTRFYLEMLGNFDKERLESTLKSIIDSRGMHSSLSQAHAFASERVRSFFPSHFLSLLSFNRLLSFLPGI
jgi:hypothetical protein